MEDTVDFQLKEYLDKEGEIVERIIGKGMIKRKVWFSDPNDKNITIETTEEGTSTRTRVMFRDALKMTDQGFGSGYKKGVPNNQETIRDGFRSPQGRHQKKFLNKPLFGMIARVSETAQTTLIDLTLNSHKILKDVSKTR